MLYIGKSCVSMRIKSVPFKVPNEKIPKIKIPNVQNPDTRNLKRSFEGFVIQDCELHPNEVALCGNIERNVALEP